MVQMMEVILVPPRQSDAPPGPRRSEVRTNPNCCLRFEKMVAGRPPLGKDSGGVPGRRHRTPRVGLEEPGQLGIAVGDVHLPLGPGGMGVGRGYV